MCEPTTIMLAVTSALTMYQGAEQKKQADHQARVVEDAAKVNTANAKNEATRLRNIGTEKENDHRRAVAEMMSEQKAQQGAAGVQLNTGSALQVREDTGSIGEVDALRIRSNYKDQADAMDRGAELTRINGSNESGMLRAKGRSAMTNSVLSAAGSVASGWYTSKSAAVTSKPNSTTNIRGVSINNRPIGATRGYA